MTFRVGERLFEADFDSSRMAPGSSLRGLSEVAKTESASRAATSPCAGVFPIPSRRSEDDDEAAAGVLTRKRQDPLQCIGVCA